MSTSESFEHLQEIAVIGMACRFPGAPNLARFWQNLCAGVESIETFSDDELRAAGIAAQALARPDYVKAGAVLEGIEWFDAGFFGMSPREAEMTDPQQRIFLEVVWEGLEDAGYDPQRYPGSIGVFAGASISTYLLFNLAPDVGIVGSGEHFPTLIGNDKDYLATHVSYKLNLRGPSMSIQTACSTSLVAIHMACQSLLNGECDIALAGGAAISVPQKTGYFYQEGAYFSPDGHCRSFSADARGTVFGSGVGVVVLKRLGDALRDGDCIDAVVKGSAINNDGAAKVGFTAPSVDGQAKAISEALSIAGVKPEGIGYVEAHGTATPLGDPIEVAALSLAYTASACAPLPPASVALGSVKSNLGHLDSAAGVAGFIKTVLSLKHQQLVPSLHCATPNPQIDFGSTPFYVNTALQAWEVSPGHSRRAGVSSFGIGGTNAHVVLEEAPPGISQPESIGSHAAAPLPYLLPLSARHPQALSDLARAYRDLLVADTARDSSERADPASLALRDLCYSASLRRAHHPAHRLAVVAHCAHDMARLLDAFLLHQQDPALFTVDSPGQRARHRRSGASPRVAFVFSGQGAQWWAMGRQLLASSTVFRESIRECDELLQAHTTRWRLLAELTATHEVSRLDADEMEITQCAIFALQIGLARLWRSYGVEPWAVIGHSMGEVAAAAVSGVLTLAEAVRVIYERSRLLQRAVGRGAMAAVELSAGEAEAAVTGFGGRVSVAADNGARASVISGERAAVEEVLKELERAGVMWREVRSSGVAGHSRQMEQVGAELERALAGLRGRESEVEMISTVEGQAIKGAEMDSGYWRRNVRERVRFREGMRELARAGVEVYVEMNAHPVLGLWVREASEGEGTGASGAVVIGALRRERGEREVTLEGLGAAYARGVEVNWAEVWKQWSEDTEEREGEGAGGRARYVRLPGYAWQRQPFWIDPPKRRALLQDKNGGESKISGHPLLARRMQSSIYPNTHFWEVDLDLELLPYLQDHRIQETIVLPASFYIEMALVAARELFVEEAHTLEEVLFENALIVHANQTRKLQLVISVDEGTEASFKFSSLQKEGSGAKQAGVWVSHVSGKIRRAQTATASATHQGFLPEEIKGRCREVVSAAEHYRELQERGLEYGPAFRCAQQVFRNCEESIARLRLPEEIARSASRYIVHPALLDSGLQLLATIRSAEEDGKGERDIYLPVELQRVRVYDSLFREGVYWGYGVVRAAGESGDEMVCELYLLHEDGSLVLEAQGIRARRLVADQYGARDISDWFYNIEWIQAATQRTARGDESQTADSDARWLIFTDGGGFGDKLASLIKGRGQNVVLVSRGTQYSNVKGERFELDPAQPEHFRNLFKEAFGNAGSSIRGVAHLWSLDFARPDEMTLETLQAARVQTCGSVLHLVQALIDFDQANAPRLWLLTRGSQVVEEGEKASGLAQAALWGLGKVVAIEHGELKCARIDLDSAASVDEPEAVWNELLTDFDEEEIAFRHGSKFVSRLKRYAPADGPQPVNVDGQATLAGASGLIRSEGTYLITGGLGGLGLAVAGWLVEKGARHLVLLSRHDASPAAQAAIDSLRQAGAHVTIARADVTQREQVAAALEEIERLSPPLVGVIHAAGTLDDGLLLTLDWERFEEVTKPKIEGAWNLHALVRNRSLDFFVMFSSAGSMLGSPGQGNHVAGNAFLDALARYRRARGMKGLSINWSQWSEVGKAAHVKRGGRLAAQGIPGLTPEQGLRALALLLHQDATQVGVMKFDLRRWSTFYPQAANASLLREVVFEQRETRAPEDERDDIRASLRTEASAWRRRVLLEEFLRKEAGWVLRLPPKDIAPDAIFSDLGLDSLRSLELRSRLEHGLALKLPATLVWQFPTIETLAPHLADKIGIRLIDDQDAEPASDESDTRQQLLRAELAQLSEEEAEALLNSKVETLHSNLN